MTRPDGANVQVRAEGVGFEPTRTQNALAVFKSNDPPVADDRP
jgi:hypothetical protein